MSDQTHHGDHHEHNHDHDDHAHDHDNGHHHDHAVDEEALREQFKRLRVTDLAYEMMVGLVTVGYQKLGLTSHTRDLRDLDDAHLAIELLRATLEVVERDADREHFKDVRATLAQMQLGYAQAVRSEEPSHGDEPAAESEAPGVDGGVPSATSDDEPAADSR